MRALLLFPRWVIIAICPVILIFALTIALLGRDLETAGKIANFIKEILRKEI